MPEVLPRWESVHLPEVHQKPCLLPLKLMKIKIPRHWGSSGPIERDTQWGSAASTPKETAPACSNGLWVPERVETVPQRSLPEIFRTAGWVRNDTCALQVLGPLAFPRGAFNEQRPPHLQNVKSCPFSGAGLVVSRSVSIGGAGGSEKMYGAWQGVIHVLQNMQESCVFEVREMWNEEAQWLRDHWRNTRTTLLSIVWTSMEERFSGHWMVSDVD